MRYGDAVTIALVLILFIVAVVAFFTYADYHFNHELWY